MPTRELTETTGIRLWSSAHNSFGVAVTIVKLRTRSPAGERQVSHNPAIPISRRPASLALRRGGSASAIA